MAQNSRAVTMDNLILGFSFDYSVKTNIVYGN